MTAVAKRPSGKTTEIGFCIGGMVLGILAVCVHLLRVESLTSLIAFLAPDNNFDSSYLPLVGYFGVEMIILSSLYLAYVFKKRQMDHLVSRNYNRILLFLCGVLSLLALAISLNRAFGPDEFEHVHSAWYVAEGYRPYTDFFQHHNPLLWYVLAPFLRVFGYTVRSVLMFRILMFLLTIGTVYWTYRLSKKLSASAEVGLLSAILLLSVVMFVGRSIEIRPDVPQVFFGMVSVYALIGHFRSGKLKDLVTSALAASVSFIFLQKTVFLLAAYALIFAFRFLKGKMSLRPIIYFAIFFSLPVSLFFAAILMSGSSGSYLVTNMALNTDPSLASFSPFVHVKAALVLNGVFWIFALLSLAYTLLSSRLSEELKTVAFIASVLLLSIFVVKHPYEQYFMQAIPLLCVLVGGSFGSLRSRDTLNEAQSLTVILVVIAVPLLWLSHLGLHNTNDMQLDKANYVIRNSGKDDYIYDGSNQFNLYRHDLHYFWYNFEKLPVYNRLTNGKYADYDICTLIRSKRPAFISDYRVDVKKCGLDEVYAKTRFDGLYVRNGRQGTGRSNR